MLIIPPRLVAPLHLKSPRGVEALGWADLSLAAASDLAAGRRWHTDTVPGTVEACMALPHRARQAALSGSLLSAELPERFERFAQEASRRGSLETLLPDLLAADAAGRMQLHAAWLLRKVSRARVEPWPGNNGHVADPLTGEVMSSSRYENTAEPPPFAFAVRRARFSGVDAGHLSDFVTDGGTVADFLALCLKNPELRFRRIALLERAAGSTARTGRTEALQRAVSRWNNMQDVAPLVPDFGAISLRPPAESRAVAVGWCRRHAKGAAELCQAFGLRVKDSR